jgi:hypothetical protein
MDAKLGLCFDIKGRIQTEDVREQSAGESIWTKNKLNKRIFKKNA